MKETRVVYVKFSPKSREYSYSCKDESIQKGDYVYLEGQEDKQFSVIRVDYVDEDTLNYKLKRVISKVPAHLIEDNKDNIKIIEGCKYTIGYDGFATVEVVSSDAALNLNTILVDGKNITPKYINITDMLIDVYDVLVSEDNPYFTYEDDILYNKDKTKVIYCFHRSGNVTIPSSVSIIGSKAFYNLNLFSITILGEEIVIGSKAFENCEYLDILNIMGSLKTIGTEAFKYSSLSNINVEAFDENFKASSFAFAYSIMELYNGVYYFSCNSNKYYFAFATSNNKEKIILHKDNKYICSDLLQINKEVYLFDDTKV